MDILGIGGWELIAVLILMIVVAGPKRMIQWSYILGREMAKVRRLWSDAARTIQKEFDEAGIDIKVPEQPPTRDTLRQDAAKLLAPLTKPVQDAMAEVDKDLGEVKSAANTLNNIKFSTQKPIASMPGSPKPAAPKAPASAAPTNGTAKSDSPAPPNGFGTWSGGASGATSSGEDKPAEDGFGTWSGSTPRE